MRKLIKMFVILVFLFPPGGPLFSQTTRTSSSQSSGGGEAASTSFRLLSTAGQPAPIGFAGSTNNFLSSGLIATFSDTITVLDVFPPLAPVNLTAAPGNWVNVNNFSVTWTNPEEDENIAGAYYKLGEPPVNNDDGTYMPDQITAISEITVSGSGEHLIYVWLKDVANNYSYLNAAYAILKYDETEPQIQHTQPGAQPGGSDITISAAGSDQHSGLRSMTLYYRETGDVGYEQTLQFSGSTAIIPASINTQRGVEYAIMAEDSAGNLARIPQSGFYDIQSEVSGNGGVELTATGVPVARHSGETVSDYRIFSIPLDLDDKRPSAVFEDDLGTYDDSQWKLFTVQNTTLRDYPSIRNSSVVVPGTGFLLLVSMANTYIYSGSGRSPNVETYDQLTLTAGWNLIGNPFDFDIPVDSLEHNGTVPEVWTYNSTGWSNSPAYLRKWSGLAIYSESGGPLHIGAGSGKGYKISVADNFKEENWGLCMQAKGSQSMDMHNYLGVCRTEINDLKQIWREPPVIASSVSLAISADHPAFPDVKTTPEEKVSTFIQEKGTDGNYWDLILNSGQPGESIILNFEKYGDVPAVYLLDKDLKLLHNLADLNWQLDTRMNARSQRQFRLIAGSERFLADNLEGFSVIPARFELRQNFPNPFNPSTNVVFTLPKAVKVKLEIYNILGQKVRTLIDGKMLNAGYYLEEWNSRGDHGRMLGSGIYLIRFSAGNYAQIRKAVLVK